MSKNFTSLATMLMLFVSNIFKPFFLLAEILLIVCRVSRFLLLSTVSCFTFIATVTCGIFAASCGSLFLFFHIIRLTKALVLSVFIVFRTMGSVVSFSLQFLYLIKASCIRHRGQVQPNHPKPIRRLTMKRKVTKLIKDGYLNRMVYGFIFWNEDPLFLIEKKNL